MKSHLFFVIAFFICSTIHAQTSQADSLWLVTHYNKIEHRIPMRDSAKLYTAIYIPKDTSEKHPILIQRTPYSNWPYGENKFANWWETSYVAYFKEQYIFVMQDVRGRFMSDGTFEDVRPFIANKKSNQDIDEASDAYDTIDWLVKNIPHNNGSVGIFGISYPGFYATMAALGNHPALKAVSPQAPVTDWFMGDDFHHNGIPFLFDALNFYRHFGVPRRQLTTVWPDVKDIIAPDNYQFFLQAGTYDEIKQKYMDDSIKFWNDVAAHPNYDAWWQARNVRSACYNVKPAVLVVGGLFDAEDCYGAWNLYKAITKQSRPTSDNIVEGPWYHEGWIDPKVDRLGNIWFGSNTSSNYIQKFELPFFNYYLKGKGNPDQFSGANIFFTGENKWHHFAKWPPDEINQQSIFLEQSGALNFSKPSAQKSFDEYSSDPMKPVPYMEGIRWDRTNEYMTDDQRFASRRADVLVYQTEVLENDVTLAGSVIADLFTSISTTDADFVVKLIDVFPDDFTYPDSVMIDYQMGGYQMLVRGEIMRGRFRNSFSEPEPFVPNKITEVKFELPDVAHTFLKGHRMMIQIQSTWFPLADRNPQQFIDPYHCETKDLIKSTIRIYHDATHASKIILPVLKK